MDKKAFLETLDRQASALSPQERARLAEYYSEMIDDRIEEGIDEEEAVAALGDPAALARELSQGAPQAAPAQASSQTVGALDSLRIHVGNADVTVVREALDNGAAAQLRLSDPTRFEWRMDGATLELTQRRPEGGHRGLEGGLRWLRQLITEPDLKVTVALAEGLSGALDFEGGGSDLLLQGVAFAKAQLVTASGDITLRDADCSGGIGIDIRTHSGDVRLKQVHADNMIVSASSGDIEAKSLAVPGRLRLKTSSGDLEVRGVNCGELSVSTASGDIEIEHGRTAATSLHTASGDVQLTDHIADPSLCVETASGEINLLGCAASEMRLKAVSGDVLLQLEPLPCGYAVSTNSVSGDITLDDGARSADPDAPRIAIETVTGDIEARIRG